MALTRDMHTPKNIKRFATDNYAYQQNIFYRKWLKEYPISGYVYLIKAIPFPDMYKIGKTTTPYKRLTRFDVKLPFEFYILALIECKYYSAVESKLHQWFAPKRIRGEWFNLSGEDIANIKLLELFMPPPQDGRKSYTTPDFTEPTQYDFFRFIDMGGNHG